jgi:Zn-dependent membrane protease YugP
VFFWDSTFLLLLPAIALALYAQHKVRSTFARYSKVAASSGVTGAMVAQGILRRKGLASVEVRETPGTLSDHYDPRSHTVNLSTPVYRGRSLAAVGVAAHEVGHAVQHGRGYLPLRIRHGMAPVASLGSSLAFPLFFIGFLFRGPILMDIGIALFAGAVLFHLVTLPVELNASSSALRELSGSGYLAAGEVDGARSVLRAAAFTYLAATAVAVMHLLRLLILRGSRD